MNNASHAHRAYPAWCYPAWCYPAIVAHRGGGKLAPENTLAAIDTGAQYGHRMAEFDVKLSADEQLFLLHDTTLERTTNGTGDAGDQPWQRLRQLDAGSWFAERFAGEPLPLLAQAAARCRQHGMLVNIEIKPCPGSDALTGERVALAARQLWHGQTPPLLSSFSISALNAARQAAPELPRGLLLDGWRDDWQTLIRQLSCLSLHINHQALNEARIAAIKAANVRIMAYTVNQPERAAQLLRWGVDCICTDRIDIIGADFRG